MEFVVITGLSGAGKTSALHALEDIGFYCVDNLPSKLLNTFYNLCETSTDDSMKRIAVVIDARGGTKLNDFYSDLTEFKQQRKSFTLIFLDASEEVLVRRFKETRRRHPLADAVPDNSVESAILLESSYLEPFKKIADYSINTSNVTTKLLKERVTQFFLGSNEKSLILTFMSFGFKYGSPNDCDSIIDVRCLPNPYYIPELKDKTGNDSDVRDYVFNSDDTKEFLNNLLGFFDCAVPLYVKEGKVELVVGVGCTGGKHRSVAIAEHLKKYFSQKGYRASVYHRDINK